MDDAKEEVRSRLNIEDVIGEYVELKRAGRSFRGLSPFNQEKTPSFYVSPEKNIWHDFSSNRGGDIFSFIMEVEGMDFRASLEMLAKKAGVDLVPYRGRDSGHAEFKNRLLEATRLAVSYYQHSLVKNPHALEYVFKKRGLSREVVSSFKIGYAPEQGNALTKFLLGKKFTKKELAAAGLTNRFGSDLFRGRMMVPLLDESGQAIGFTGRILNADVNAPKYLNTPATILYDKSRHIFGLTQAKEAIRKADYSVVVEGNLDVVSSHQFAVSQVVATAGTAMTERQLKTLSRLGSSVRLGFDGDRAGIAATERVIPIASSLGINLMVVNLPEGFNDPDELVREDVKLWTDAIENAEPAVDWVLRQYEKQENLDTGDGKRRFSTRALEVIKSLSDPVEQDHYKQVVAKKVGASMDSIEAKLSESKNSKPKKPLKEVKATPGSSERTYDHLDTLIGLGLIRTEVREVFSEVDLSMLDDPRRKEAVKFIQTSHEVVSESTGSLKSIDEYVNIVIYRAEKRYNGWRPEDERVEAAKLLRQFRTEHQKRELEQQIKTAEEKGDEKATEQLRQEYYSLIKEEKRG